LVQCACTTDAGIARAWDRLGALGPLWAETWTVLVAFVVLLVLRRLVDADARKHAHMPAVFLLAALLFRAVAPLVSGFGTGVLGLLAILCLVVGLVSVVGPS
jgi:hypothetical protein